MSLVFGAFRITGSGGGKTKAADPAQNPTNFFDSATASVVDSTAGNNEPEAAKLPDDFFDSATMAVMGKQSAEQLQELDGILNPSNFFDKFAGNVMGLSEKPETPAVIIRLGETTPAVPSQPEVPFGPKEAAKAEEAKRAEAEKREKEAQLREVTSALREREKQEKLEKLERLEEAKKTHRRTTV